MEAEAVLPSPLLFLILFRLLFLFLFLFLSPLAPHRPPIGPWQAPAVF